MDDACSAQPLRLLEVVVSLLVLQMLDVMKIESMALRALRPAASLAGDRRSPQH